MPRSQLRATLFDNRCASPTPNGFMEHLELTNNMIVSGTILVLTFIGIFTEHLHGFARSKFALLGAGFMMGAGLLFDFYTPDLAGLERGDLGGSLQLP